MILALPRVTQAQDCAEGTLYTSTIVLPDTMALEEGDIVRARSTSRDLCGGEAVIGEDGAHALTLWGEDAWSDTEAFEPGEAYQLWVERGGVDRQALLTIDEREGAPWHNELTYKTNGVTVVADLALADPVEDPALALATEQIETTSNTYSTTLTAQVPDQAALVALTLQMQGATTDTLTTASDVTELTLQGDTLHLSAVGLDVTDGGVAVQVIGPAQGTRQLTFEGLEAVLDLGGELVSRELSISPSLLTVIRTLLGDISGDGTITLQDVQLALGHVLLCSLTGDCLDADQVSRGDMTGDGQVRLLDAALIYQAME